MYLSTCAAVVSSPLAATPVLIFGFVATVFGAVGLTPVPATLPLVAAQFLRSAGDIFAHAALLAADFSARVTPGFLTPGFGFAAAGFLAAGFLAAGLAAAGAVALAGADLAAAASSFAYMRSTAALASRRSRAIRSCAVSVGLLNTLFPRSSVM